MKKMRVVHHFQLSEFFLLLIELCKTIEVISKTAQYSSPLGSEIETQKHSNFVL